MSRPIVLCFSGHDPSGGAGIQADSEAIHAHACHCVSIITALTAQNTHNVSHIMPQSAEAIYQQADTLLTDMTVNAFKIGLLGHHDTVSVVQQIIQRYPAIPVIFDPVLAAGGGTDLANQRLITAIIEQLLPYTTILTPNAQEARRLLKQQDVNLCAKQLLNYGCDYVLITGADEPTAQVQNRLYHAEQYCAEYTWQRLPERYHGSGCTLSASIAANIALGLSPLDAIQQAQDYTWQTLAHAYRTGSGQLNPQRFFKTLC